ncbi:MAG: endopeptidase La [Deltaproteobacteria bacterium]|nr:endopeptidase La [Deltaproteobacteria bacterium]
MTRRPAGDFEIPGELPILPLRESVVFPYMVMPLFVTREKSVAAIEDALAGDRLLLLLAQRNAELESPGPDDLHRVGTVAMVMRTLRMADGRVKALVQGIAKARVESFVENEPAQWAQLSVIPDEDGDWSPEAEALGRTVRSHVEELLPLKNLPPEILSITANIHEPGRLADLIESNLRLRLSEAQEVLEAIDPLARLRRVDALLRRELEIVSMQAEIQSQAKEEMSRGQREHYLREQLRAIQTELGETDQRGEEVSEYRQKLDEAGLPAEASEEALRQLRRLERMHPDGPEAQVVRSYLDWMCELPWSKLSPDRLDLKRAKQILDEDHAHLETIKERILEFLGVRKLRQDSRGPILCLSGPPGVGKTSLGRSIARAMGREFVRMSLGGVRDEAEIRGHRRTYVGALPGRILQGLKHAKTRNPLFILDELDKLGADFRGDPSAALLEVLDPEQNSKFSDHYLNVPFDLSAVFFIATANVLERVPAPLRDRMEVVRVPGYTPEEKLDIARSYLIPRQTEEAGLPADRIRWSEPALRSMVTDYTFEAGVRELERKVAAVCRKAARRAAEGDTKVVRVEPKTLSKFLGPARHEQTLASAVPEIGVATGLAWTEAGGDVLRIESTMTRGRGLVLTGQLGDVMKESAQAALTWVRWRLSEFGVDEDLFSRRELHVHVPAGAIPKDGPSAGVTMATALASIATGIPVRPNVAMTGEVTLRGRVLPVGGVREKALAALRAGITTMLLPEKNLEDLREVPKELARKMKFVGVAHMDEVLEHALERSPSARKKTKREPMRVATRGHVASVKARGRR